MNQYRHKTKAIIILFLDSWRLKKGRNSFSPEMPPIPPNYSGIWCLALVFPSVRSEEGHCRQAKKGQKIKEINKIKMLDIFKVKLTC